MADGIKLVFLVSRGNPVPRYTLLQAIYDLLAQCGEQAKLPGASRPDNKQENGAHGGVCAPQPSPVCTLPSPSLSRPSRHSAGETQGREQRQDQRGQQRDMIHV